MTDFRLPPPAASAMPPRFESAVAPVTGPAGVLNDDRAVEPGSRFDVALDLVPATPPPEVQREIEQAARNAERLRENGRELRFEVDEDTRRVRVEVRDLEGRLLRTVPPSHALFAVAGELLP